MALSNHRLCANEYKSTDPPIFLSRPASSIHLSTHNDPYSLAHPFQLSNLTTTSTTFKFHQKCLPKLPRKSPPLVARPQPVERRLLRRKKPERRPLPPLARKKRNKTRKETYSSYIYKGWLLGLAIRAFFSKHADVSLSVLKQVHPDTGISNRAMSILNSFVNGTFPILLTRLSYELVWLTSV